MHYQSLHTHSEKESFCYEFITFFQVQLLHPKPGWVEIDPHVLWEQFVDVITEVMEGIL